jgi:prolyl-tRNA synthetase
MYYSKLFGKTKKNPPKDEITKNAQLLVQAGYVNKLMAGVYSYLPLGLKVLNKIEQIIREEMNAIGGQEVLLPALHPSEIWQQTGGWENIDVLFKIKSRTKKDYALGQSHEEVITPLAKEYIQSYKDLPVALYQIQQKFRDELRAKSGVLRGREFDMKDMYSWHKDQADFERFYEEVKKAYLKIFERCGLVAKVTEASGGSFTQKISYEFMILTDAGEDDILYCDVCEYCVNLEIAKVKEGEICPKCNKGKLTKARAVEAGNVFDLGQKYNQDFDFQLTDEKGEKFHPIMGCYGIGVSRLMGVIVEKWADEKGIVWPESMAPFAVYLIELGIKEGEKSKGEEVYQALKQKGVEVLFDDRREVSAGQKFSDAELIGIPVRLVVSAKTGEKVEYKKRLEKETELISLDDLFVRLGK